MTGSVLKFIRIFSCRLAPLTELVCWPLWLLDPVPGFRLYIASIWGYVLVITSFA